MNNTQTTNSIIYRHPVTDEGYALHDLAKRSKTLDVNSCYHYLLLCRHFAKTCRVAVHEDRVVGYVTGYIPPEEPDTLFIWQVTVDSPFRGKGLGLGLLESLAKSLKDTHFSYLKTTITPDNKASVRLFTALARRIGAPYAFNEVFFSEEQFGESGHLAEMLFQIGPVLHL